MRLWPVTALLLLGAVAASAAPSGPGTNDAALKKARRYIAGMEKEGLIDRSAEGWRQQLPVFPEQLTFSAGRTYLWNLETPEGPIRVELMPEVAPGHVSNLIYLSDLGYFDGLDFYKIVPGFMAQGGLGKDGPQYFQDHEMSREVLFDRRGRLAMGTDGPGSAAGLFFFTMRPTPWLDGKHTIFGQVSGGSDTLEALELRGVPVTEACRPLAIEKAWVSVVPTPKSSTDDAVRQVRDYIYLKTNMSLIDREDPGRTARLPEFPDLDYSDGATYFWDLETNLGSIRILLLPHAAPRHVSNVLYLTELGFYDGLTFHRVIPGFMAQAGLGKNGAPGYTFEVEKHRIFAHDREGMVSMANVPGRPKSDSSEFFITFKPTAWLNQKHAVFGEVAGGMETVLEIEKRGSKSGKTSEPVVIERAVITVE